MDFSHEFKNIWKESKDKKYSDIMDYSERYISFMSRAKTEREANKEIIKIAEKNGFKDFKKLGGKDIKPGDKIYYNYRDKSVVMVVIGSKKIEDGLQVVGAHIDAPRLDLKPFPLYEDEQIAFLKTHYYGGIKKFHWATIPLALHGVCFTKDGKKIDIVFGEDESEPVLYINDLLIHLADKQMNKNAKEVITGEQLNVLAGSIPNKDAKDDDKTPVKDNILKILNKKYGITETDFLRAEFEIVPAGKARSAGFDNSMIMAHGHDDRVCSYAALEGILNAKNPEKTSAALFVDKEEIGSIGNTSMGSDFFENFMIDLITAINKKDATLPELRHMWENTNVLSGDVTNVIDPTFPEVVEKNNSARLGGGIVLSKYGGSRGKSGSNDANAEFLAYLIDIFDKHKVIWQSGELGKVDEGGGGTIAYILANKGAQVIDCGTGMLSMHSPNELLSKADAYMTSKAYEAFYKE